ncbi:P47(GAG-CRK) protein [Turdus rufiventris]|nr:P47(GAG-CRK) protein [Turdus rufiventris]
MDAIAKVVCQFHTQWGIGCKLKDFILAVPRLIKLGAIESPVEILHPEIRDKCTRTLAKETMPSGSGKTLKSWRRVIQALQKAREEQEPWKAARTCLLATLQMGIGTATQTAAEFDQVEGAAARSPEPPPWSPGLDSPPEKLERTWTFWQGLADEARNAAILSEPEAVDNKAPPPYAFENGARARGGGWNDDGGGGNGGGSLNSACAGKRDGGVAPEKDFKTYQSAHFKSGPFRARTSPSRRQGEPRGRRERPNPRKKGPEKKAQRPGNIQSVDFRLRLGLRLKLVRTAGKVVRDRF